MKTQQIEYSFFPHGYGRGLINKPQIPRDIKKKQRAKKQTISDAETKKRSKRLRDATIRLNNIARYDFGYEKDPLGSIGQDIKKDIAELKRWRKKVC